jgi:hypothetical protein
MNRRHVLKSILLAPLALLGIKTQAAPSVPALQVHPEILKSFYFEHLSAFLDRYFDTSSVFCSANGRWVGRLKSNQPPHIVPFTYIHWYTWEECLDKVFKHQCFMMQKERLEREREWSKDYNT